MRAGFASRTAEQNALFRALETTLPADERLFEDRLAAIFLNPPLTWVGRAGRLPGVRRVLQRIIDRNWPGVRTSLVARTRLIDEMISTVLDRETLQVVILGAGFDTRAYRLPYLRGVNVFEVDHPDTQASKRSRLERTIAIPTSVSFVPTDFRQRDLNSVMLNAGYRRHVRTFFLWEGVTNYLTEEAVDATLRWCAQAEARSHVLFTYVHRDILTHPEKFAGAKNLFASLERSGERFTFGLEPEQVAGFLAERGLRLESDVGAAEYRRRYYGEAAASMRGHEFYRVALATVIGR